MRIKSIKYTHSIKPSGSCGTGYSEPSYFNVETEENIIKEICIDIWYRDVEGIREEFTKGMKDNFGYVGNLPDAYKMFANEIKDGQVCPYSYERLMKGLEK